MFGMLLSPVSSGGSETWQNLRRVRIKDGSGAADLEVQ